MLGTDDPDVLTAPALMARILVQLGDLSGARRAAEEGLANGEQRLGDAHPVMLGLSYELARIAGELGNVYEAKRRYGLLERYGPSALGEDHPAVGAARRYLAGPGEAAPAMTTFPDSGFEPVWGSTPTQHPAPPSIPPPDPEPLPVYRPGSDDPTPISAHPAAYPSPPPGPAAPAYEAEPAFHPAE